MDPFEEKSKKHYNRIADHYDESFDGKFTVKFKNILLDEIRIKPGDCVLDVACGNGTLLKMISERYAMKGYGVDIAEKMIENARIKCPEMVFEVKPCDHTAFEKQMFDVITICVAYHHFPDVKAFAKEANRLLKPGGLLYIAEGHLPWLVRILFNPWVPLSAGGNVKIYSAREIQKNFKDNGFESVGIRREGMIQVIEMRKIKDLTV